MVNQAWKKAQNVLDKQAHFNMLVLPDSHFQSTPIFENNTFAGAQIHASGHRLDIVQNEPDNSGLAAKNTVGGKEADIGFDMTLIPDDFRIAPGRPAPATALDMSRNQRVALNDFNVRFLDGSGFSGFGSGKTYPIHGDGKQFRVGAIGTLANGSGKLSGATGMWVVTGCYRSGADYHFNILVMVVNPNSNLVSETPVAEIEAIADPLPASTYQYFHTHVPGDVVVGYKYFQGNPMGLVVPEHMWTYQTSFTSKGPDGLQSYSHIGTKSLGDHPLDTAFQVSPSNPTAGQSQTNPLDFTGNETWKFQNESGEEMGSWSIKVDEGRAILTSIEVEALGAQMFGGFGPVARGRGALAGREGFHANIGVGTMGPHWTSIVYIYEFSDPNQQFRA